MTTETKATHTPGPWEIVDRGYIYGSPATTIYGTRVAMVFLIGEPVEHESDPDRDFPEAEANARLIAAAPALLEAAEAALEGTMDDSDCPHFQGTGTCNAGCHSEPSCETNRPRNGWPKEQLRAAIALARGEA